MSLASRRDDKRRSDPPNRDVVRCVAASLRVGIGGLAASWILDEPPPPLSTTGGGVLSLPTCTRSVSAPWPSCDDADTYLGCSLDAWRHSHDSTVTNSSPFGQKVLDSPTTDYI